jgi:hypothetical protein
MAVTVAVAYTCSGIFFLLAAEHLPPAPATPAPSPAPVAPTAPTADA